MNQIDNFLGDLAIISESLEKLEKQHDAKWFYDSLSGSIIWSDELPASAPASLDCLRFVLNFRTGLLVGQPDSNFEPFWQEARRQFPNWIGFSPERTTFNRELAHLYGEKRKRVSGRVA